jgi:hypothetical protein
MICDPCRYAQQHTPNVFHTDGYPPKARVNLELMMKRQLDLRREETKALHAYVTF